MPFDWYKNTIIPQGHQANNAQKHDQMVRREINLWAKLFFNLGYDKAYAKRRISANLRWEYEMRQLPDAFNEVEDIISQVYRR